MAANAGLGLGPAYLTAEQSSALDEKLMSDEYGYTIDNLMSVCSLPVTIMADEQQSLRTT